MLDVYLHWKLLKILIKKRKNKRRLNLVDYNKRKSEALRNQKIKSFIDFDVEYSSSFTSLAVKQDVTINLTTRFLNGKMLMFSKVSLKSFVYHLIDVFTFPNKDTRKIYDEIKFKNVIFTKIWQTQTVHWCYLFLFVIWVVHLTKENQEI